MSEKKSIHLTVIDVEQSVRFDGKGTLTIHGMTKGKKRHTIVLEEMSPWMLGYIGSRCRQAIEAYQKYLNDAVEDLKGR